MATWREEYIQALIDRDEYVFFTPGCHILCHKL
jgi:hypothetical protein